MKHLLLSILAAGAVLAPTAASAARLDHWDAISDISSRFNRDVILDDIRSVHPCTSPDGSRYCTKADGTRDELGHAQTINRRQHNYEPLREVCREVKFMQKTTNASCEKGDRPFDRDPFDGK